MLAPEPLEFEPVPLLRVDGVNKMQTSLLKCRGRRWFGASWSETPRRTLRQVIDDEANFNFRPYSHTPIEVLPNLMFARRSESIPLRPRSSISVALKNLVAVLVPTCLRSWRAGTSWWLITPTGLFDNSGPTKEMWSR